MINNGFKDLLAWQKAVQLATLIYKCTDDFPSKEIYGLTSQMRRASVSISSNIAEGYRRKNPKEYAHFVKIAFGSASELETQLIIAENIGYLSKQSKDLIEPLLSESLRLLNGLTDYLNKSQKLQ